MRSMNRRETKAMAAPPADLLVCFPARAHLALMPKPANSPARAPDSNRHRRRLKKPGAGSFYPAAQASPLLRAKTTSYAGACEITSEPTSPKVTCAGQIKIRPSGDRPAKRWQSVMEEIERIHNNRKLRKKPSWGNSLGFKREIFHFLSCLRGIRFDLRCFRGFTPSDITSDDEYEEEEEEDDDEEEDEIENDGNSRTVFSKWFMVLQEDDKEEETKPNDVVSSSIDTPSAVPPPNALLLMRCRSAPPKSWLQEKPEEEEEEEEKTKLSLKALMAEEKDVKNKKKKESLVVMNYGGDFYKLSSDIAKETWVRSQSWKK